MTSITNESVGLAGQGMIAIEDAKRFLRRMSFSDQLEGDSRLGKHVALSLDPYQNTDNERNLSLFIRCRERTGNSIDWNGFTVVLQGKNNGSYVATLDRSGTAHLSGLQPQGYRIRVPDTWGRSGEPIVIPKSPHPLPAPVVLKTPMSSFRAESTDDEPWRWRLAAAEIHDFKTGFEWKEIKSIDGRITATLHVPEVGQIAIYLMTCDANLNGAHAECYFVRSDDRNCEICQSNSLTFAPIAGSVNTWGAEWQGPASFDWPCAFYMCVFNDIEDTS